MRVNYLKFIKNNMKIVNILKKYSIPSELAVFAVLAPILNVFALVHVNQPLLFYILQFTFFVYMVLTPGLFFLPLLINKKLPFAIGLTLSAAISLFFMMLIGLLLNFVLPIFGITGPLSTLPLLIAFDVLIVILFIFNAVLGKDFILEIPKYNVKSIKVLSALILLPILSVLGSIILNNGGSYLLTILSLVLTAVILPIIVLDKNELDPSIKPIALYLIALSFLLMNSMRGWFVTGHDILLEHHVFVITTDANLWSMAFYQDPYNACLSLTILPTYLHKLLHLVPGFVYKFYYQFLGALSVVVVYYINKLYIEEKLALLAGFLFITFPTFMVDMAFLNRQGVAFLFFASMLYVIFGLNDIRKSFKYLLMYIFGLGMIFSHYSTSYIAIPLLISAYVINRVARYLITLERPYFISNFRNRIGNKEMYTKPVLLSFVFIMSLLLSMVVWSSVITKTSKSFANTINQVITSLKDPFSLVEQTGPAKYSLLKAPQPTPEELLQRFVDYGVYRQKVKVYQSEFFPLELTSKYKVTPILELSAPLTILGDKIENIVNLDLGKVYGFVKQTYARILQLLLITGLIGFAFGYGFRRKILREIPIEYVSISISGILIMIGQTVLPAAAIDYGLLRLFQQNLIFLALPILLGLTAVVSIITRNERKQMYIYLTFLTSFFLVLSGVIPQLTGGGRPLLSLNNSGLYYDSYYTHAEEVASIEWITRYKTLGLPIQAAHFSDIKMIAYGHMGAYIELIPETTKRKAFVYLNYDNVKKSNILEIIYGDVIYYRFPMEFLNKNKNLIYNNGGSIIYR